MRWSLLVALLGLPLACAQVLKLGDFGAGGGGPDGGAGTSVVGGSGGAGGTPTGGSGGALQGGGGTGGAGCAEDYFEVIETDDPVAWIRFEEVTGSTVMEEDGHEGDVGDGVDLDVPGLPPCGGNSAAHFSGESGANIDFGNVLGFEGSSSFSVELWLRTESLDGTIVHKLTGSPATGYRVAFYNQKLWFYRYLNGVVDSVSVESSLLGTHATHHVVGTYDGIVNEMRLYVDGFQVDQSPSFKLIASADGSFLIGTAGFQGVMDELALYSRALAPDRIEAHYAAGRGVPAP